MNSQAYNSQIRQLHSLILRSLPVNPDVLVCELRVSQTAVESPAYIYLRVKHTDTQASETSETQESQEWESTVSYSASYREPVTHLRVWRRSCDEDGEKMSLLWNIPNGFAGNASIEEHMLLRGQSWLFVHPCMSHDIVPQNSHYLVSWFSVFGQFLGVKLDQNVYRSESSQ